ncbi:MAG: cation diffusion facilitator family transporter [Chitinophagaceae bacterium]|jgi:cation diffusion facilitator family transporter|nr:cation diffusion facilitator family transporter [Chitinophagaceae bacterium]
MEKSKQNLKLQTYITGLSVVLFAAKIIAYYITHSLAILTDALESIVNILAGFIGLYSLYVASKPRDMEHPYGHGKAEFVSAAAEGALIVASGIFIIYETVQNIIQQHPLGKLDMGILLVGMTGIINYAAGFICIRLGKKNNSLALQASGKHLQIDTYSTLAVIIGLLLMLLTNLLWIDKVIAGGLSILIIYNGYKILRDSLAGIMDEADKKLLQEMVDLLNSNRSANRIDLHNLRVIKYGATLHVDCHLTVPWYLNVHEAHVEVDALSNLIKKKFGNVFELFVHTDGCLPFSCNICLKENCKERQRPFTHKINWTLKNLISNEKHNYRK